jgi:hypothetical protein
MPFKSIHLGEGSEGPTKPTGGRHVAAKPCPEAPGAGAGERGPGGRPLPLGLRLGGSGGDMVSQGEARSHIIHTSLTQHSTLPVSLDEGWYNQIL